MTSRLVHTKHRLGNGLTLILHEDRRLPVAGINLWYRVGARDEEPSRTGFAHLFEHLMFMGTDRVPEGEFDAIMEAGGGWNNASTSEDRTDYYSFGPSDLLPTLLWLEADRLESLGRCLDQDRLDRQRDVVRNERRQSYENAPYGQAELLLPGALYPSGHPYDHPVIGSHADLEAAGLEDVRTFFERWYLPSNLVLAVAGDFESARVIDLVNELFGDLDGGVPPVRRRSTFDGLENPRRIEVEDAVQKARLTFLWHSPAHFAPGDAELDLAAAVMAAGKSSRLDRRLVQEERLATSVRAHQMSGRLGSLFQIEVAANAGADLARIEGIVADEVERLRRDGPSADELERRRAAEEYSLRSGLESVLNRAERLVEYEDALGSPDGLEADLARYADADVDGVRQVVRSTLVPTGCLTLAVVPKRAARPTSTARSRRPATGIPRAVAPPPPDRRRRDPHLETAHFHRPDAPLAHLLLTIDRGALGDPVGREGLAWLHAAMLDEGHGPRGAAEFTEEMERLGARVATASDHHLVQIACSALPRNAERAFTLAIEAALSPPLHEREWQRVKRLHLESLAAEADDPARVAARIGPRLFFGGDHPYGRSIIGTANSIASIDLDDVRAAHATTLSGGRFTAYLASAIENEPAHAFLTELVGRFLPDTKAAAAPAEIGEVAGKRRVVIAHRPDAVQTLIRLWMPAVKDASPDRIPLLLLDIILGGSFTSRLNQNLREEHGWTYGVRSGFRLERSCGWHVTSTSVEAGATGDAVREILAEIDLLTREGVDEDEAEKARRQRLTDLVEGMETGRALLATAAGLDRLGHPHSILAEEMATVAAMSIDRLNAVARTAYPIDRSLLLLVGDRDRIRRQLDGIGLPDAEDVDPQGIALP